MDIEQRILIAESRTHCSNCYKKMHDKEIIFVINKSGAWCSKKCLIGMDKITLKRLNLYIPEKLHWEIKQIAAFKNMSLTHYIERVLNEQLIKHRKREEKVDVRSLQMVD